MRVDPLNEKAQKIIEKKKQSIQQAKRDLKIKERYKMNKGDEDDVIVGDREIINEGNVADEGARQVQQQ